MSAPTAVRPATTVAGRALATDRRIGRLLIAITYLSVGLLAVGVGLMVVDTISPTSGGPRLELATLGGRLLALEPAAFLWAGMLAVIAAPIGRVIVAAAAYAREADWLMVVVSVAILVVIAIGILSSVTVAA